MGGRVAEPSGASTALGAELRQCRYFCILEAQWKPGSGDKGRDAARAWVRECAAILAPHRSAQLTYAPDAVGAEAAGVEALPDVAAQDTGFSGGAVFERLRRVKGKYDPDNFFRQNHNISPVVG